MISRKFEISGICCWSATLIFLPVLVASNPPESQSEIFSSTTELQRVLRHEIEVVSKLEEYAKLLDQNLRVVQKYIQDFNKINDERIRQEEESVVEIMVNPMNAYHILKRTVVDWGVVAETVKNATKVGDLADEVIKKAEKLPSFDDFLGGSMALVSLQDTYALNLTEIIHGSLPIEDTVQRSPYELNARDCLFLGKSALNKGLYHRAVGWLEMALQRAQEESDDASVLFPSATQDEIQPWLEEAIRVHDNMLLNRGPYGETWQTFEKPINTSLAEGEKFRNMTMYKPKIMTRLSAAEENENFKALCRGEYLRNPKLDASLRCRYVSRPNSLSLIGPYKVEENSLDPYIVLYHDFMGESEMNTYKELATPRLKRSLHQGRDGKYIATDIRTSQQAWLAADDHPLVEEISARIGDATNLEVFPQLEASEIYQVANYGMGGRYKSHTDYITGNDHLNNELEARRGNRIATFMVYLEDVQAGGGTAFPFVGVHVRPKKGAAVFWYNLRSDGRGDPWTRHGGCSVLYGNKWITNKWIRYHQQFKRIPCVDESNHERNGMFHKLAY